ncbi:lytic transglycosylase domain-containing protein [Henriciella mobilis]|uniref:lytic transglycosylase domain-containing protein n=1 Tax=Henriciella mobilis TaxID=2305467 RepID=UPI000E66C519|nr:lytic transglycosylase domain-containing protein [Henriciella mobilis]RIJ15100.1 lytic transglycosylase domain-containing protein [Henriciella mobilis]RIJ20270.1 lytic transglycosylase domain-containing protein [Henriciella mobilis]
MRLRNHRASLAALLLISAAASASAAIPPAPSLKPDLVAASNVVSTTDAGILRSALNAAAENRWSTVRSLEAQARSEIVRQVIRWYRGRGDLIMSFDELSNLLRSQGDWPQMTSVQVRAEEAVSLSALNSQQQIDWFEEIGGPVSGAGRVALAEALRREGRRDEALTYIRQAWHGNTLDDDLTNQVLARYGSDLTPFDHQQRADFLLWTAQHSAAARLQPYLSPDWRRLVEARSSLQLRRRGVDGAVDAVPEYLQDNPGLLYDRAKWRRRAGQPESNYVPLLAQIDGAEVPSVGRDNLWRERSMALRSALKDGDFTTAYQLAEPHGMSEGTDFAEAEWLAGWIALRQLEQPEKALGHFENLGKNVSTPISQSRADYWRGRALEALGRTDEAQEAYALAAQYPFVFYGQLAAEKTGNTQLFLQASQPVSEEERAAFNARPLVQALKLLAENGEAGEFRQFAYHLDDMLATEADYLLLSELASDYLYADIGVRGAKAGLAKGIVATDAAFPVPDFELLREPDVERAMMYALSRQESEMNPSAVSHANARGLMQFIPSTARMEARNIGLPYKTSWLTDDPGYNMTLGGAHLDTLLDRFNGSYIMTAAAYNAGASRPARWIRDYGDPRTGEIDPIDWIEFIPFSETRNYVQRVLENTQVYRQRLSGEPVEIRLSQDLQRGRMWFGGGAASGN